MESELCFGCGLMAWTTAFLLTGGGQPRAHSGNGGVGFLRDTLIKAMAQTQVVSRLLGFGVWTSCCEGLSAATAEFFVPALSKAEASGLALLVLAVSPFVGLLVSRSLVGAVGAVVACALGLVSWGANEQRKRSRELADEMPLVFRTLAVALSSGQTLSQAIAYVGSHEKGPVGQGFSMASLRLRCGEPADAVLSKLAKELDAPGIDLMVTALTISQRTGSPLKDLFQHSARLVEREREMNRELAVKTAQVRMSARVVCVLPLLLVVTLSLISPDFQEGVSTPVGMCCLGVAAFMDVVAILIMRRLMRGVL